ncbi:gliding motility-associated C-terminal domain-containing protein [Flavobacterium sp. N502536]|uniref:gliding motility-associated C-terminal domain-containing protein n=1 Tax=Flavobacterium sp. N502536 TaxID=2986837 RepID=UPI002222EF50|nr:gliding motility-associated C-terminal domain-containing protein [Flavobacterium sp. N502536]
MRLLNLKGGLLLLLPYFVSAQTINKGELFVAPNTQLSSIGAFDNTTTGVVINDGELFLYSHLNNSGLVSFNRGNSSGIIRLYGESGYQNISGSVPIEMNNVEFKNSNSDKGAAFHVSNYLSIFGTADFKEGIIDDDAYDGIVIFENGSSCLNASDKSFIDGEVKKIGNKDFTFPIGDRLKYRSVGISALKIDSDAFSGKYFLENADNLYPLKNKEKNILIINSKEYWTVKKAGAASDIIITLSWDEATTPATIIESPSDIHIVRWDNSKKAWVDQGGIVNLQDKTVSSPASISGEGVFTIAKFKKTNSFVVYNSISPNNDGLNEYLRIDGLEGTENEVEIYNRWGVKVFQTTAYGTKENVFDGFCNVKNLLLRNEKLPSGTYFYILSVTKDQVDTKQTGYLYLSE